MVSTDELLSLCSHHAPSWWRKLPALRDTPRSSAGRTALHVGARPKVNASPGRMRQVCDSYITISSTGVAPSQSAAKRSRSPPHDVRVAGRRTSTDAPGPRPPPLARSLAPFGGTQPVPRLARLPLPVPGPPGLQPGAGQALAGVGELLLKALHGGFQVQLGRGRQGGGLVGRGHGLVGLGQCRPPALLPLGLLTGGRLGPCLRGGLGSLLRGRPPGGPAPARGRPHPPPRSPPTAGPAAPPARQH